MEALYNAHVKNHRTSENNLHEPRGDDYGYNKGTICLLSRLIGGKGTPERAPLNSQ